MISYRLLGAYVEGSELYLKTNGKPILYLSYPLLHGLKDIAQEINQYATRNGYSRFPKYIKTSRKYFITNFTLLILGWIIILYLAFLLLKKINSPQILIKKKICYLLLVNYKKKFKQ